MEAFFGIVFALLVAIISIWLAGKYKEIAMAILIAFFFRICASLINLYVVTLPDGGIDATGFENMAWLWGKDGLADAFSHFFEAGPSWLYSNLASLLYAIFGHNPLILSSVSVLAGVYCVVLVWKVTLEVWGEHGIAKISAWLVALSPILILYSSLTMREVFITLLLLYGTLHVVLWSKSLELTNALIAFTAFAFQVVFHPGIATAGILFVFLLFIYYNKLLYVNLVNKAKIDYKPILVITFCLILGVSIFLISKTLAFPYSNWLDILNSDILIWRTSIMASGAASYPSWVIGDTPTQFVLLMIPKLLYFLFSPFPWDISKFKHIIGMFDGVVYLALFASIYGIRKKIKSNHQALLLVLFLLFLSLIFTIAVGNFGTGIRHRSKLLPIIIVLAAPFVYRVFFSRKKN